MQYLQSVIFDNFLPALSEIPTIAINRILQTIFFSMAVSSMVGQVLDLINFSYSSEVATNKITYLLGGLVLWYFKVWQYYDGFFYLFTGFTTTIVAFYVYDCCGNISTGLERWNGVNRQVGIMLASIAVFFGTGALIYLSEFAQTPLKYPYIGFYLIFLVLIVVLHIVRRRSILYALIGLFTINYIILSRIAQQKYVKESSLNIVSNLPLTSIIYLMMALDAQKKQRMKVGSNQWKNLFFCCLCYTVYGLLNSNQYPVEVYLGGVFWLAVIINR